MRGADTGEVGQGSLDCAAIFGPRTDAVLDVLGEAGIFAITIGIGVVLALSKGDPCVQTLR